MCLGGEREGARSGIYAESICYYFTGQSLTIFPIEVEASFSVQVIAVEVAKERVSVKTGKRENGDLGFVMAVGC